MAHSDYFLHNYTNLTLTLEQQKYIFTDLEQRRHKVEIGIFYTCKTVNKIKM